MSNLLADIARRRQLEAIRGKAHPAVAAQAAVRAATGPTLNDVLKARGFTTSPAAPGRKNVLDGRGHVVLENVAAHEVWDWLRTGHKVKRAGPGTTTPKHGKRKKKRKAKKRAKAAKPASTPAPKKKPKKKKPKKKAGKKKRAKAHKPKKAKKHKAKKKNKARKKK